MITLRESLTRARSRCSPSEVWCITRFDRRDATLEIYWSEKTLPGAITSLSLGSSGIMRPYGGHAECMMIMDFGRAVTNYGTSPTRVEIFLSRSPCDISEEFNLNGVNYPKGCARKIKTLITNYPAVRFWDIRYDKVYWGNPLVPPDPKSDKLGGSVEGIATLASLPKVSIHQFNELDIFP